MGQVCQVWKPNIDGIRHTSAPVKAALPCLVGTVGSPIILRKRKFVLVEAEANDHTDRIVHQ